MKLSKSEAGKLGAIKSRFILAEQKQKRITIYKLNPKICSVCNSELSYQQYLSKYTYCSRSCRTKATNARRIKTQSSKRSREQYFQEKNAAHEIHIRSLIDSGSYSCRKGLKKILIKDYGHCCSICKHSNWNNSDIPLEIDHIDGNAGNNQLINLRLLCPNCHAQQPTSKGKNRGNGRKSRNLPLS